MTREQLASLERALGLSVPQEFRDGVVDGNTCSGPVSSERYVGFRPLLIHNLRLRDERRAASWPTHLLALGNDGCGNEYVMDTTGGSTAVFLFEGEQQRVLESPTFAAFGYDVTLRGDHARGWPPSDVAAVSRSADLDESIVAPISLAEWRAAVAADDSLELSEFREGRNPFTKETVRLGDPGKAFWHGPRGTEAIQMAWGALYCRRPSEEAIEKLRDIAERFNAHVLLGWEEQGAQ